MEQFFNSNSFVGLATIITGAVAIFIYLKQRRDFKIQAARVLLLEVRTAEDRIDQVKDKVESGNTTDLPSIFPTKSWKTYSHLFVSDFDQDELKLLSAFYDYGELVEDFAKRNNDFFWVTTEERARVVQQKLAELVIHSKTNTPQVDLNLLKQELLDVFASDPYSYAPQKTINAIKTYLQKVQKITTTSAGVKLKDLAKLKS